METLDRLARRENPRFELEGPLALGLPRDAREGGLALVLRLRDGLPRLPQPTSSGEIRTRPLELRVETGEARLQAPHEPGLLLPATGIEGARSDLGLQLFPFRERDSDALLLAAGNEERLGFLLELLDQLAQMDDAEAGPE